jgi:hypothetical protein
MDTVVESARLMRDAGVPPTSVSVAASTRYIDRTRRARRYGIVLGLVAGFGPLAASSEGGSLLLPRMFAGYLVGLLASELFVPHSERPAQRSASLRRTPYDLVGRARRWLPWLALLPALSSPLLLIGWHPRGRSHATYPDHGGSCTAVASWPTSTYLFGAAGMAIIALVVVELTLHRLSARRQPAEDPTMRALDHAMRGHSARSTVAAAAALGLVLIAQIANAVAAGVNSYLCMTSARAFNPPGNVYSWSAATEPWLQQSGTVLTLLAVVTYLLCRHTPTAAPCVARGSA